MEGRWGQDARSALVCGKVGKRGIWEVGCKNGTTMTMFQDRDGGLGGGEEERRRGSGCLALA